jgi:hypothetical protein
LQTSAFLQAVAWKAAVWEFVGIICIAAPLKALAVYTEKRMIATWRASLSEAFITAYTSNRCYFHMQLARGTEGAPDSTDTPQQQQLKQHNLGTAGDSQDDEERPASVTKTPDTVLQAVEMSNTQHASTGPTNRASVDKSREAERARALAGTPSKPDYVCVAAPVPDLSGASACVDNPDQRITNDVANYVSTSVTLVHLLGKKLLHCAAFAGEVTLCSVALRTAAAELVVGCWLLQELEWCLLLQLWGCCGKHLHQQMKKGVACCGVIGTSLLA